MAKKQKNETEVIIEEKIPTSELNLAVSEALRIAEEYRNLTSTIQHKINDIFSNYLIVGTKLNEINDKKLYELEEYQSIQEYANQKFGLSTTTIHNVMAIASKFSDGYGQLLDKYEKYSFSTLVELLSVNELDMENYSPVMTVKEVRNKKLEAKINEILDQSTSSFGSVTQVIERIKSFDIHTAINNLDARLSYDIQKQKYEVKNDYTYLNYIYKVVFTISNLIKPKTFEFHLNINTYGFTLDVETRGFYKYSKVQTLTDVDAFMTQICNILRSQAEEEMEKRVSGRTESQSNSLSEFSTENKWNMINPLLNQVAKKLPFKAYYEHLNNTELIVYKEAKKNKKKNPPLFKIYYPDDLNKIQVVDLQGKMVDEFSEVLKKRDELLIFISDTITNIVHSHANPEVNITTEDDVWESSDYVEPNHYDDDQFDE